MIEQTMPLNCLRQWQFRKYKAAMIPILIILFGFVLKLNQINIPYISVIMSISLVAYLAVIFIYRFGNPKIPEGDNLIVSPVHGKISSVEQVNGMVKIRIDKSIFDPIEIRCPFFVPGTTADTDMSIPYGSHEIQISFGDKLPFIFHEHGKVMGSLLGLIPGSYHITIKFNESVLNQAIALKRGDLVKAGETILAELINPIRSTE